MRRTALDGLLGPLEIAVNRTLAASPDALEALAREHEPLQLELRDLGWALAICPAPHGLQLLPAVEAPRVRVTTSLVGLARLAAGEDIRELGEALRIDGDAEYADWLFATLRAARVDLEAELSARLGPVLGDGLRDGARGLLEAGQAALKALLLGGGRDSDAPAGGGLASGEAVRRWMDEVDALATDIDRLEARIRRLEAQD